MDSNTIISLKMKKIIDRAIELYNKYRSPESTARLVRINNNIIVVRFDGSFCETCGINDWVEDFKYTLEDLGITTDLIDIIEPEDPLDIENWRIGVFKIIDIPGPIVIDKARFEDKAE